jgi:predicted AlkP superfamily phosphohydrolase/phosphomutase
MTELNRREFLKLGLTAGSLLALGKGSDILSRGVGKGDPQKKVLILGLDGLDPHLLEVFMKQGKLPAFARLRGQGDFKPLRTGNPPQSPVAWSNFITGMNPGGHGIFDFLKRKPETYDIIFSGSRSEEATKTLSIGNLVLPLAGGEITNLRKGKAFWQILEAHDIPATVFKIPSNYPPVPSRQKTLSGLGTPDIKGYQNLFNYYTTEGAELNADLGGGRVHEVYIIGNRIEAKLPGPYNTFKKEAPESTAEFQVLLDPVNPVAKIVTGDEEFILKEGEWSGWKKIRFRMIPTQSVSGICQFYLKQVRPAFKLYVSSINIDPRDPFLPISTPRNYSRELAKKFGPFHTKGLPADTHALDHGLLDDGEFLHFDDVVMEEKKAIFEYELNRFDSGLFFHYVSSTDQRQHMFWRLVDKNHPMYDPQLVSRYGKTIENIYIEGDKLVDKALQKADKDTTIIVMSDHGFTTFRRSFNLNSWLVENGYLSLINPWKRGQNTLFMNTDWSRTKAFALGLNSLYINQRGREAEGIVAAGAEKANLVHEIAQKLEGFKDPKTGENPVLHAFVAGDVYDGPFVDQAPDIVVGYNRGYRVSWATPLGREPEKIIEDNTEKWSGDHCIAPEVVPGILMTNRKIKAESPALYDLTATILDLFGIDKPEEMIGRSVY